MRGTYVAVSLAGLMGAGGFVAWTVLSRPTDVFVTGDAAAGFNLQEGPEPVRSANFASGEALRDAVAAAPPAPSSLTAPIATEGMAYGSARKIPVTVSASGAAASAPAKPMTVISARAETWARGNRLFAAMAAKPAAFFMSRSALGSARSMKAFLADPKKVDAYMNSALVRIALNSPTFAKAVLGNPAVIRAFLASPAMKDPAVARALVGSPMVRKMLDCPAIQEALGDPAVMQKMVADPQTIMWIAAHPDALMAITNAVPALGDALTSKR
ncbi:MAG: hypothetical protein M0D55_18290 [Elusimicrobiota bacterium]|nr:MAG: hypothetical protein M0D55_18290 [Elusimicrobiota bacterium]